MRFLQNKRGVLFVYMVLIIALIAGIFFAFFYMNVIEKVQDTINPLIAEDQWAAATHYSLLYYATLFVTNLWTYIVAIIVFILAYWAYIYSQRRGAGY